MGKVITFHAFTDNRDEWRLTRAEADEVIKKWRAEGFENLRIYEESSDYGVDDEVIETCVFSEGEYPD